VTLSSFQWALVDLAASPTLCRAAQTSSTVFDRYDLTERERRRLEDLVRQRGMATQCALDRAQRMGPLSASFSGACLLLGERLPALVDAFWEADRARALPDLPELEGFAAFLRDRLANGELEDPFLDEVLAFEQALHELKLAPACAPGPEGAGARLGGEGLSLDPRVRLVAFRHDPTVVLGHLALGTRPAADLPSGVHFLLLRAEGAQVSFQTLEQSLGEAAQTVKVGAAVELSSDERALLIESGLAFASS
jgi:hypothetical protein